MQTEAKSTVKPYLNSARKGVYERYIKRLLDLVLSICAIIALLPILLIVALMVKVDVGNPVIFKQKRPGMNEKIFTLYKFRTMTNEKDETGKLLSDGTRLTKFGKFLRSTSLDELPELLNIVRGDMSVIGPRPLLVEYLPLYSAEQKRRHVVRPGLTGLAQVNGRNLLKWSEKFRLDIQYVDSITFIGDIKIFLITLIQVIKRVGINSKSAATMEAFQGTKALLDSTQQPD